MFRDVLKAAALKAAEENRQKGNLAKVRAALSLARLAAGIEPLEHRSIWADLDGCLHFGRTGREASLRAHEMNRIYV